MHLWFIGPVCNVFNACRSITRACWRELVPGVFWALWNGIEPIGEGHLEPKKLKTSLFLCSCSWFFLIFILNAANVLSSFYPPNIYTIIKVWWPDATLFYFISFSFIHTLHSYILTFMNIRRGSSPFLHRWTAQWQTPPWGAESGF